MQNDMPANHTPFHYPFGDSCCENEMISLKEKYEEYFFSGTDFAKDIVDYRNYLIIGRRGTGKSSLTHYLSFHSKEKLISIDVDEPEIYDGVLDEVAEYVSSGPRDMPRLVKIWEAALWNLIFEHTQEWDAVIRAACQFDSGKTASPASIIKSFLEGVINRLLSSEGTRITSELEKYLEGVASSGAREKVIKNAVRTPIYLAIDSLEKYDANDTLMMMCSAALVEAAAKFNREFSRRGIHVKVFMSAEIFPVLSESYISNISKYASGPMYLHWRPKDLMRLVAWRWCLYLRDIGEISSRDFDSIDWLDHSGVKSRVWDTYFGSTVSNKSGRREKTYPYILRHTQLRPRQLILICNRIAELASNGSGYPRNLNKFIVQAVSEVEIELGDELVNSFDGAYAGCARILDALSGMPMTFRGNELDKIAKRTASEWKNGEYSSWNFKRLVAELGVVGRLRANGDSPNYLQADFEYSMKDRLALTEDDMCAIHPMVYEKFQVNCSEKSTIYPFPRHIDYDTH